MFKYEDLYYNLKAKANCIVDVRMYKYCILHDKYIINRIS